MAGMCCGLVGESETGTTAPVEPSSRVSRRKRLELLPLKFVADVAVPAPVDGGRKRQKLDLPPLPPVPRLRVPFQRDCDNAVENCKASEDNNGRNYQAENSNKNENVNANSNSLESMKLEAVVVVPETPKFGMTSVCGRRRDMEDAVSIHRTFSGENRSFFGVFDGHGCSHVAMECRDRLHEIVKEEIESFEDEKAVEWKETMERSFMRMDKEVERWTRGGDKRYNCRCELQSPQCDAVGSTAVVALVTPDKIVVSNCGDSRAVLCRKGVAIPLSSDHKPDRADELLRIQAAGGRVIYWDGPRVLGVLAMSRAIGDGYLKPYVIPEPEVIVAERSDDDECLILASDGLWDVVSNDTACGVARMCLRARKPPSSPTSMGTDAGAEISDEACSDASILLTKLALARHSTDNVSVVVVDLRRNRNQH